MDDVYDYLDNYNEVNRLEELQTENRDLKEKLDECSAAMGKLQKDYDHIALEFKKLEMNYSSLLKTARAEIERKTEMITNLNIEKDMLVIKSMQNGNIVRRSFYGSPQNLNRSSDVCYNQNNVIQDQVKEEHQKNMNTANVSNGKKESPLQSQELTKESPVENNKRLTSNTDSASTCTDKKDEFRVNNKHEKNVGPKIVASSIKNRRKSMSAVSTLEEFSSDDEFENSYIGAENKRSDVLPNYKPERKILDRVFAGRHNKKTSETSSLEGRHQEASRETYRNRPSSYYNNDKYRSRDKHEYSQRHRRHISPDRNHKKLPRETQDDHHYRKEHWRTRVLESPPDDSYHNKFSNYYQRRNREHRTNYDSRHDRFNEYDRYKNRYEEKQPIKHKLSSDYEEPSFKRHRTESLGADHTHHDEVRSSIHLSNRPISHQDENWNHNEREVIVRPPVLGLYGLDDHISCQSPDYTYTEAVTLHPIREIKNIALVPLEDPRKFSKKYVLKSDVTGTTTISTVTGRNIDIIPIDKTVWNIERVEVPRALKIHPSQFEQDEINEIYTDVDNPVSNLSIESGEISCNSVNYDKCVNTKDQKTHEGEEQKNGRDNLRTSSNLNKYITVEFSEGHESMPSVEHAQASSCGRYRIPKINPNKNTKMESSGMAMTIKSNLSESVSNTNEKSDNKYNNKNDTQRNNTVLRKLIDRQAKLFSNKENQISNETKEDSQNQIRTTFMVEGDLELSDENSDIVETERQKMCIDDKAGEQKSGCLEGLSNSNKNEVMRSNDNNGNNIQNLNNKDIITPSGEKFKISDGKKHKSKKKKSKSKDVKEVVTGDVVQGNDKKKRSKKEKPNEIKQKFSDLFGDSGSLIMPEDLGITTYVPTFVDNQDTVDLNIKTVVQTSKISSEVCNENNFECKKSTLDCYKIGIDSNSRYDTVQDVIRKQNSNENNGAKICLEVIPNIVHRPQNPESAVDSDIVKTVIISTGMQLHFTENKGEPILEKSVENTESSSTHLAINEIRKQENIIALATSTPQKGLLDKKLIQTENTENEPNQSSNISNTESIESIISAADQREINTLDSQNNTDVPDVRIFVKRRKRLIRKPPVK